METPSAKLYEGLNRENNSLLNCVFTFLVLLIWTYVYYDQLKE